MLLGATSYKHKPAESLIQIAELIVNSSKLLIAASPKHISEDNFPRNSYNCVL